MNFNNTLWKIIIMLICIGLIIIAYETLSTVFNAKLVVSSLAIIIFVYVIFYFTSKNRK